MGGRGSRLVLCRSAVPQVQAAVIGRIVTRENRIEAITERETIESRRRRNHGSAELAPERRNVVMLEHEARHPEQRLAEKRAADSRVDLVVLRRQRRLAEDLPKRAAGERVAQGFPVIETGRSREAVIHRSLVRMSQLIGRERIAILVPSTVQIAPDRRQVALVVVADVIAVVQVEENVEADDLERRKDIVHIVPVRRAVRPLFGFVCRRCAQRRFVRQRGPRLGEILDVGSIGERRGCDGKGRNCACMREARLYDDRPHDWRFPHPGCWDGVLRRRSQPRRPSMDSDRIPAVRQVSIGRAA